MSLIVLLLLPFIGSCLAAFLPHNARNAESFLAGLVALVGAIQMALWFPQIADGGVIREEYFWLPSLGMNFVLRIDGFAWLFSMLVLGIGALVSLYARYYMSPDDPVPRFFAFFLAFMGAMLGLVMSGNLIQIVFFWELTSLFSFLLIGYWHHRADARRGAYMALMVTGAGGLALLAGMMILGHVAGSYDLDRVLASGDAIRAHALYPVLLTLILIGALWLPHAMAAPTPVSAYLHSATMVKAGVFLMARMWPSLSGSEQWFWMVSGAGACTLILGAYAAIFQNDLKGLLAYSTISHLGLITLLLGLRRQWPPCSTSLTTPRSRPRCSWPQGSSTTKAARGISGVVCGLMTCITFVWFSAPDLALTQLVVEVVTTVLILLGLRWLPRRNEDVAPLSARLRARTRRIRDFGLAVLVGVGMAILSYAMLTRQTPNAISSFYLSRALPQGGGTNVVNVMLVDFRGFDTFGEITVLAAVALTVFALLRRFRPPKESILLPAQQRLLARDVVTDLINPRSASDTALGFLMVPAALVRLLLPIAFIISMYLFIRGHNQPGGGFVAGLVMSVAFLLQYMVAGTQWVEAQMSLRPLRWMGTGLLVAVLTGAGSMALGYPFMTTHTAHVDLPILGDIHIASALFFDVGRVCRGGRVDLADSYRAGSPVGAQPSSDPTAQACRQPARNSLMEEVIAVAISVLAASGVWLILRPRTFQVVMGLCLLSYGVNLFIFSMGSLFIGKEPIIKDGIPQDLLNYTDPLPQALVLTAIVISFAMTALFLVVLLASRGLTGTDHVDGREPKA